MKDVNVGANIRQYREGLSMTQQQLAEAVGTTITQIGRYERNEQDPTATKLIAIARVLKVDPGDLLQ